MPDDHLVTLKVDEKALLDSGVSELGRAHFHETLTDYATELLRRAVQYANVDTTPGSEIEVAKRDIRQAAKSIATKPPASPRPRWYIPCHVIEYVAMVIAGFGGGHWTRIWAPWVFAVGLAVAVILIVCRLHYGKKE